ncbi:30S ribosomal protein S4 [Candidatus Pacearchaeota archaeon]|nr:30S ribosomal protein S4 [Candidatus Pacearchaeota archaeon]
MLRKKKLYLRPRKAFEKTRIGEENVLVKKYGLKNKKEVWKTLAKVNYFRRRAKELARSPIEEQEVLFGKLKAIGLKVDSISDVLGLSVEDLLARRLPTIVNKIGLATTPKQARQLVTHKKILVNGNVVNSPSYIVRVAEEKNIFIKIKNKAPKQVESKTENQAGSPAEVLDKGGNA